MPASRNGVTIDRRWLDRLQTSPNAASRRAYSARLSATGRVIGRPQPSRLRWLDPACAGRSRLPPALLEIPAAVRPAVEQQVEDRQSRNKCAPQLPILRKDRSALHDLEAGSVELL